MRRIRAWLIRLSGSFSQARRDRELAAELESHLQMHIEDNLRSGMTPAEARRNAMIKLGGMDSTQEACRDRRSLPFLETLLQDLRYAVRMWRKNPGFSAIVVLILALGIGSSTAIYSVVNTLLLHPLPGRDPERLVQIAERLYDSHHQPFFSGVSPPVLEALLANRDYFADLVWWDTRDLERETADFIEGVQGAFVSPNFFRLWEVRPLLGRTFAPSEAAPRDENGVPQRDSVIILSYGFWNTVFAADRDVVGKTIELSKRQFTVIGVMPPHFQFPNAAYTKFWVAAEPRRLPPGWVTGPNTGLSARLRPGVNARQTQAMLDAVATRLMKDHAGDKMYGSEWRRRDQGLGFWVRSLGAEFTEGYGSDDLRKTLFGLLGAIGFVLLIVCANVANLTLANTERRAQELLVRSAMGAGRLRLARQLLTESVLLACLGGVGGLVVTIWGLKLLVGLIPEGIPRLKAIQVDGSVLGGALIISLLTGLLFGLAPAWRAGRTQLSEALKQAGLTATAGRNRGRWRGTLVVGEVALTVVLLTGAGLMIQSVVRLLQVNPGFDPENLLRVHLQLPWGKYAGEDNTKVRNLILAQLHERLASLPGVIAAGIFKDSGWEETFIVDGRTEPVELYRAGCGVAESDCFRAMRIPLLAGRYFDKSDIGENVGTVMVNESLARVCWPGENAVGKTIRKVNARGPGAVSEVVGVVADARIYRYDEQVRPLFFRPYQEQDLPGQAPVLVLRTQRDPRGLIPAIREELKAAEPGMKTPRIFACRQALYDVTQAQRTYVLYLAVFAGVGLVLSALGIYGVLAYAVARRTREFGIRLALGAQRSEVLLLVMREGARLVGLGVGAGLLAAYWLTRLLEHQLFQVSPTDPLVLTIVVLVLLAVALLACYLPARRATKVNPIEALRCE